jgi:hypothetical protein
VADLKTKQIALCWAGTKEERARAPITNSSKPMSIHSSGDDIFNLTDLHMTQNRRSLQTV